MNFTIDGVEIVQENTVIQPEKDQEVPVRPKRRVKSGSEQELLNLIEDGYFRASKSEEAIIKDHSVPEGKLGELHEALSILVKEGKLQTVFIKDVAKRTITIVYHSP